MEVKHYDLMIVGNGFDLNCGLKTRYVDFLASLKSGNKSFLESYFSTLNTRNLLNSMNWCSLEEALGQLLTFIHILLNKKEFLISKQEYGVFIIQIQVKDIIPCAFDDFRKTLSCVYYPSFINILLNGINLPDYHYNLEEAKTIQVIFKTTDVKSRLFIQDLKDYIFEYLRKDLERLENDFCYYLSKNISLEVKTQYECKNNISFKADRILNFNYTSTCRYISSNIQYVHGSLEDKNIVIGVDENMNQSLKELSTNYEYLPFFKRTQGMLNGCNKNYSSFIGGLQSNNRVAIFGHSLDTSDSSILYNILNKDFIFDIYYFSPIKDQNHNFKKKTYLDLNLLLGTDLLEVLYNTNRINLIEINTGKINYI